MEDVTRLTKEEFLKFLNCSHHNTKTESISVPGPKNSLKSVVKRYGNYEADRVKIDEFSLNNQILRIPLPRVDLQNLSTRQVALKFRTQKTEKKRKKNNVVVSRFGRKLKKKQLNIQTLTRSVINTRNKVPIYSTRSLNKIKSQKFDPKKSQKFDPKKSLKFEPRRIVSAKDLKPVKPEDRKIYSKPKKMEVNKPKTIFERNTQTKLVAFPKPQLASSPKPHFIIKYVPSEPTYFLKMGSLQCPQDGILKYSFDTLVKDIKNMKLPSPTWKIKVVVKSNKIASIIFTNKCVLERTVTFNAKNEYFEVVIENRPAILLGSPGAVSCIEDIEILLNIIHTISAKNPMIYYKSNIL